MSNISTPLDGASKAIITIHSTKKEDLSWVHGLHERVFGPGRFARAAFRVRENFPIDKNLSLIAKLNGKKVASISMTPISIDGKNGYLLGPLATEFKSRGLGIGGNLVKQVCKNAMKNEQVKFVLLVGEYSYYGRLGFQKAKLNNISFPAPLDQNRILLHCADKSLANSLNGSIRAWIKS